MDYKVCMKCCESDAFSSIFEQLAAKQYRVCFVCKICFIITDVFTDMYDTIHNSQIYILF